MINGCHSSPPVESQIVVMPEVSGDFQVPSRLWDEIIGIPFVNNQESTSHQASKNEHGGGEHGGSAGGEHGGGEHSSGEHGGGDEHGGGGGKKNVDPLISFNKVKVILTEKNPNVLNEKSYTFEFPRGGGYIDLAKYVNNQNGSFFIQFQIPESEKSEQLKAFFVSKSKKRKIENEIWGSGCNSAFEITRFFKKSISQGTFKVNTTRDRHLSLIGGHFIISVNEGRQIKVTQVTFYDSRRLDLMCDNKEPYD
jgi:hypothetical protein